MEDIFGKYKSEQLLKRVYTSTENKNARTIGIEQYNGNYFTAMYYPFDENSEFSDDKSPLNINKVIYRTEFDGVITAEADKKQDLNIYYYIPEKSPLRKAGYSQISLYSGLNGTDMACSSMHNIRQPKFRHNFFPVKKMDTITLPLDFDTDPTTAGVWNEFFEKNGVLEPLQKFREFGIKLKELVIGNQLDAAHLKNLVETGSPFKDEADRNAHIEYVQGLTKKLNELSENERYARDYQDMFSKTPHTLVEHGEQEDKTKLELNSINAEKRRIVDSFFEDR